MVDNYKNKGKKSTGSESNGFVLFIKNFLINYVGLIIIFPLFDLIKSGISHEEFHYSVISHIASPAIWALILTVIEIIWLKSRGGKK